MCVCVTGICLPSQLRKPRNTDSSMKRWWPRPRREVRASLEDYSDWHISYHNKSLAFADFQLQVDVKTVFRGLSADVWKHGVCLEPSQTIRSYVQPTKSLSLIFLLSGFFSLSRLISWHLLFVELKDAQKRKKQLEDRCKLEESIGSAAQTWNQEILPNWSTMWVQSLHLEQYRYSKYFLRKHLAFLLKTWYELNLERAYFLLWTKCCQC